MNQKNKPLAFKQRNDEDFVLITEKIQTALSSIEEDEKIPATCEKLAELAKCSRKTLNNRKWPVEKLRQIKLVRKAAKEEKIKKRGSYEAGNSQATTEEVFILRIETLQKENGNLFDRVQSLEEQLKTARELSGVLEQDNKNLRKLNSELQSRMWKNNQAVGNVVEISSRSR